MLLEKITDNWTIFLLSLSRILIFFYFFARIFHRVLPECGWGAAAPPQLLHPCLCSEKRQTHLYMKEAPKGMAHAARRLAQGGL